MKVGSGNVATGFSKKRLFFTSETVKGDPHGPKIEGTTLPTVHSIIEAKEITESDLERMSREFVGYPIEKRIVVHRLPQQKARGIDMPSETHFRYSRGYVIASGPDASIRVRLKNNVGFQCDIVPGDIVEFGVYAAAEIQSLQFMQGIELILLNVNDLTFVVRSKQIEQEEARQLVQMVATSTTAPANANGKE